MIGKLTDTIIIWMGMSLKRTEIVSSEVDATKFSGGEIIYHQTRQHYYQIINRIDIKCDNGEWKRGWSYVRVKDLFGNKTVFEVDCDPDKFRMYVRTDAAFDADWLLIRAVIL